MVFVEIMIGLVVPILFMLSVVPINSVLRYVTYDRVDIRKIMPKLLPFISFKVGEKHNYWSAIDTFYFEIKDDYRRTYEDMEKRKWFHLCDTTKSTVIIFLILAFNFLLAWSVFVNGSLVDEFGPESCRELTNVQRERAVCISLGNRSIVNCSTPESATIGGPFLCFQFLRFSEQMDIFQSLTSAVVLYFITQKFIAIVLEIIRFFYLFHKSWIWAALVVLSGVAVIGGDVALIMAALFRFTTSFDLGQIFELLIIGMDIILVGVLLLISTPLELVPVNWKPYTSVEQGLDEEELAAESRETLLSRDSSSAEEGCLIDGGEEPTDKSEKQILKEVEEEPENAKDEPEKEEEEEEPKEEVLHREEENEMMDKREENHLTKRNGFKVQPSAAAPASQGKTPTEMSVSHLEFADTDSITSDD